MENVVTLSAAVALCKLNEDAFVQLTGYRQPFMRETAAQLAVEYVQVICSYVDKVEAGAASSIDRLLMQAVDHAVKAAFAEETAYWDAEYRKAEEAGRVIVQRIRNVLTENGIDPDAPCDRKYRRPTGLPRE